MLASITPVTDPQDHEMPRLAPSAVVLTALRSWIEVGRFRQGDPMPSEREIAKQLNVARTTVRAAYAELASQGLIESAGGRMRRVVRASAAQAGVLSRTVAVISELSVVPRPLNTGEYPHGWDLYTYAQAVKTFQSQGYHILTLAPMGLAEDGLARILSGRPMGLLLTHDVTDPSLRQRIISGCARHRIPLVADGDNPELAACDRVTSDHQAGCRLLTRWLLAQGRRRIVRFRAMTQPEPYWLCQRDRGHEQAMREAGLEPEPILRCPELPSIHDMVTGAAERFQNNLRTIAGHLLARFQQQAEPDAIMTISDPDAYTVHAALRLLGKVPGKDVLVVGYDDTFADDPERLHEPMGPAATVNKCNEQVGRELARMLLERVAGNIPPEPQRWVVEPRVVIPAAAIVTA